MKVAIYSLNQAITVMKQLRYKRNKHNTLINKLAKIFKMVLSYITLKNN